MTVIVICFFHTQMTVWSKLQFSAFVEIQRLSVAYAKPYTMRCANL